jgi:hypothetical protein
LSLNQGRVRKGSQENAMLRDDTNRSAQHVPEYRAPDCLRHL